MDIMYISYILNTIPNLLRGYETLSMHIIREMYFQTVIHLRRHYCRRVF